MNRTRIIAAALVAGLLVSVGVVIGAGLDPDQPAPATAATAAPTTTVESATGDPGLDAETTMYAVRSALVRHGHLQVSNPKRRDPEGATLFGVSHSWELRVSAEAQDQAGQLQPGVPTIPSFVHIFANNEAMHEWLGAARGFGAVVLYDEDDVWVLSLESDGPTLAKIVKLARQLDRQLDEWTGGIHAIT